MFCKGHSGYSWNAGADIWREDMSAIGDRWYLSWTRGMICAILGGKWRVLGDGFSIIKDITWISGILNSIDSSVF